MSSGINSYGYIKNFPIEPDPRGDPSSLKHSIRKQAEIHERVKSALQNSWNGRLTSKYGGRKHSFSSIVEKQVEVILSQLNLPWNIDFNILKNCDEEKKEDEDDNQDDETEKKNKKLITRYDNKKNNVKLGLRARQAIASSAQAWVYMRNQGLLRMAKKILSEKDQS